MASVAERFRRRPNQAMAPTPQQPQGNDWTTSGSFINKPQRGWLHPDEQLLPDAGVAYGVRYIGNMVVKQSMKSLDFDTRTALAKESISRVCDAAGLKTPTKKSKKASKISKLLGGEPNLGYAGANVNLRINTETLQLMVMESGELIVTHQMPGISFASGGDPDTMDFVAYVAKDEINGRACFVLECGGGLAQDVITTIGQAFELRYKQYLAARPEPFNIPPERTQTPPCLTAGSNHLTNGQQQQPEKWPPVEEKEYYNDHPGAQPPIPTPANGATSGGGALEGATAALAATPTRAVTPPDSDIYASPTSNQPVPDSLLPPNRQTSVVHNLIDLSTDEGAVGGAVAVGATGDTNAGINGGAMAHNGQQPQLDAFDMKPFTSNLPASAAASALPSVAAGVGSVGSGIDDGVSPVNEAWYHGQLSRQQTELRMKADGDFLVRESVNSPGQYVLSGMHKGRIRHLLLVDPQGIVRTKDRTFDSVKHLINYHLENKIPIVSQDSELALKNPVLRSV